MKIARAHAHRELSQRDTIFLFKLTSAMDRAIRLEDVSRRRLTHDDVLQTH